MGSEYSTSYLNTSGLGSLLGDTTSSISTDSPIYSSISSMSIDPYPYGTGSSPISIDSSPYGSSSYTAPGYKPLISVAPSSNTGLGSALTRNTFNWEDPIDLSTYKNSSTLGGTNTETNGGINYKNYSLGGGTTNPPSGIDPPPGTTTPFYKNYDALSTYAGLGSALASLASLPSSIKFANAQTKALKYNLATAKEDKAFRDQKRENIRNIYARDTSDTYTA